MDLLGRVREQLGLSWPGCSHRSLICILRWEMGRSILVLDHQPLVMKPLHIITALELAASAEPVRGPAVSSMVSAKLVSGTFQSYAL
ncbi:MAG: hypothetical protein QOJ40_3141 [Verrucomicrobiota bacterium]